jgi:hypothetical protein
MLAARIQRFVHYWWSHGHYAHHAFMLKIDRLALVVVRSLLGRVSAVGVFEMWPNRTLWLSVPLQMLESVIL